MPKKSKNTATSKKISRTQKILSEKGRILELDFLRGLAVLGMVIFHYYYILDFYGIQQHDMTTGAWHILGQFVRFTFLALVGISMTFSRDNTKRALIILLCAMGITLGSYIFYPEMYIRFGILHLIAISIFLTAPLKKRPYTALMLGVIAILFPILLLQFSSPALPLIILGVRPIAFTSFDLFPIFPWIGISLFGIFFGNKLYTNKKPHLPNNLFKKFPLSPICVFGKHALIVYMLHIPVILALLLVMR